ncbi:MAG: tetratricopeptide repeat protein, partial [Polyangiales bacterium]
VTAAACARTARPQAQATHPTPPPAPTVLFKKGIAHAKRGDLLRAEQYLAAAQVRGMPAGRVMPALLKVCIASGRLRVAQRYAVAFARRHPRDWRIRYLSAGLARALGDDEAALGTLREVTALAPQAAPPHFTLASLWQSAFFAPERAAHHYGRYLALAPHGRHAAQARAALEDLRAAGAPTARETHRVTEAQSADAAQPVTVGRPISKNHPAAQTPTAAPAGASDARPIHAPRHTARKRTP